MINQFQNNNQEKLINFNQLKTVFFLFFIASFFFVLTSLITFFLKNEKKSSVLEKKQSVEIVSPKRNEFFIPEKTRGELKIISSKNKYKVGDLIEIGLIGNLEDEQIVGYDLIIAPDKQLDFQKSVSVLNDFSVYTFMKDGLIFLTGIKSPQSTNPTFLKNLLINKVYFKTQKKGIYKIDLITSYNQNRTKLVNEKTQEFYPQLTSINIEVE